MLSTRLTPSSCSTTCSPLLLTLRLHSRGHGYVLPLPPNPHRNLLSSLSCSCTPISSAPPSIAATPLVVPAPVINKRKRYRKSYPGEAQGITEEMRFVAMKLRKEKEAGSGGGESDDDGETWQPTMDGYLKYLVDSRVVFDTIERIVDRSDDVSYAYFRKTGLERGQGLSKDLEHFSQLGFSIPEPGSPGTTYAAYLKEIAGKSMPSFLSHFYNIYFAHISGGQAIGKQVSDKLLDGRVLEFYKWPGDDPWGSLKNVREALNKFGEHWTRAVRNQCLNETAKCFRMSEQIVRLLIS